MSYDEYNGAGENDPDYDDFEFRENHPYVYGDEDYVADRPAIRPGNDRNVEVNETFAMILGGVVIIGGGAAILFFILLLLFG